MDPKCEPSALFRCHRISAGVPGEWRLPEDADLAEAGAEAEPAGHRWRRLGASSPAAPPPNPAFIQALSAASGGRIIPVPGGVLIRDQAGEIIAAVGISGDISENDETCAVYGIECAGLVADTGDPGLADTYRLDVAIVPCGRASRARIAGNCPLASNNRAAVARSTPTSRSTRSR
jgi:hypothetical protein